ncbi:MAG: phosphoribosylamine--glycine ligase [Christensenellales bacterium]|jgi:phosphoribosylamine--glycine ligase
MKRDILVIGGGGREHAIVWALKKSDKCGRLYCAPGNAGIDELAECVNINVMEFDKISDFAIANKIDTVFVAPDDPLAAGLVNHLKSKGIRAFGPDKEAAVIESSKSFSKDLMKKYNIPTAGYEVFDDYYKALTYIKNSRLPIVLKADGLALGKGVIIADTYESAQAALKEMMIERVFGESGSKVIIEEFMTGQEVSVLCFTDGKTVKPMVSSQDHKRALDNDRGLNTGGMGTFAPSRAFDGEKLNETMTRIILPTINAMASEGRPFKGVLYFGLMMTADGVKVVEYNSRFGDPETQVILPLLKTDLIDIIDAVIDERLDEIEIEWSLKCAVCVILASGGYPKSYAKGLPITIGGIDEGILLFHAGTAIKGGALVTSGGRVMGVTATAETIEKAREKAYANVRKIHFDNMHYRTDIGIKL